MTLYKWSQTPASNATADSTINWAEGQAPSSVNDSARAMMTAVAKYRDDTSGYGMVTGGSSTAYTVTSHQVFSSTALMVGMEVSIVPHATNGDSATLNVDSLGAFPIYMSATSGLPPPGGTLVSGTIYSLMFNTTHWLLRGFFGNPYNIPLGGFLPYAGATAPNSNFVLPFGQAISRTTYATLFSLVSSTYGAGDGSTTFNIPDLRGRGIFFGDSMGGSAANRLTTANSGIDAANVSANGGSPNVTVAQNQLPNVGPTFVGTGATISVATTVSDVVRVGSGGFVPAIAGSGTTAFAGGGSGPITGAIGSTGSYTPAGGITSINGGVTQQALITMPPAYILNCIMRVI